jgi:hypothetical protein
MSDKKVEVDKTAFVKTQIFQNDPITKAVREFNEKLKDYNLKIQMIGRRDITQFENPIYHRGHAMTIETYNKLKEEGWIE